MRTVLLVATLAMIIPTLSVGAESSCDGNLTLGIVQIGNDADATFYLEDLGGIHVYQETNGVFDPADSPVDNLQHGGSGLLPEDAPVCWAPHPHPPDWHIV